MWIGIDGGGSNLRVAAYADDLSLLAEARRSTVNPSVIGRPAAATLLREAIDEVLAQLGRATSDVQGVGVGIAGAYVEYAADWLHETFEAILPGVPRALSSDVEIALTGAHGAPLGLIVLSGTGSVAYGINASGASAMVGGWGYLVGDEGSGYSLGAAALRHALRAADGRDAPSLLAERAFAAIGAQEARDSIQWIYGRQPAPTREIAGLASLVLQASEEGDAAALRILNEAADELFAMVAALRRRLRMPDAQPAFAGGLLTAPTALSRALCQRLSLDGIPPTQYPPSAGAAILAQRLVKG